MRCRTFLDQALPSSTLLCKYTENGVVKQTWTAVINGGTAYDVMYDVSTPNYKKLVAQGRIINNPMVRLTCWEQYQQAKVYCQGYCSGITTTHKYLCRNPPRYPVVRLNSIDPLAVPGYEDYDNERSATIASAWSRVDMSKIQILATIGELPETLKWISSVLYRLRKLLSVFISKKKFLESITTLGKRLRKKKWRESSWNESVGVVSDLWLELRYAVRPLCFEMENALRALHEQIEKNARYTARAKNVEQSTARTTHSGAIGILNVNYTETSTSTHTYRAGVMYGLDRLYENFLSTWGVLSPVEAAWELIPFSFVLDWFANIGDVISAHVLGPGINPKTSWIVETHSNVDQRDITNVAYIPNSDLNCFYTTAVRLESQGFSKRSLVWKRRLPTPAIPNFPVITINLDIAKILDLTAIVRSLVRKL